MRHLIEEYAQIKSQIKELTEKAEAMQPQIIAALEEAGVDKIEASGIGTATLAKKKIWKYTEEVDAMAEGLKALKSEEQANGNATFEEDKYLVFKPETKE